MILVQPGPRGVKGQTAEVTSVTEVGIGANAAGEVREAPLLTPPGYEAVPLAGTPVALLPMEDYTLCAGEISGLSAGLLPGEVRIKASSGAFLHLRADGSISLNGLVIGPDGQIMDR